MAGVPVGHVVDPFTCCNLVFHAKDRFLMRVRPSYLPQECGSQRIAIQYTYS